MDPILLSVVTVGLLLFLIGVGLPIAYALATATLVMMVAVGDAGEAAHIAESVFQSLDSIELVALPMFIFMGAIIAVSPAGADIYRALHRILPIPGGLGVSAIGGCTVFAAMSGSSPATVAAIGSSGVPEMLARRYPPGLAAGTIVGGGTLGILIPPSIVLLLYGVVTKVSIGQLFLAGILPGLMVAALFSLYTVLRMAAHERSHRGDAPAPAVEDPGDDGRSALRVLPFFVMVVGIMVALYGGWATPSEIAAVGSTASIILVGLVYRLTDLATWSALLLKTVRDAAMILLIAAFSYYLSQFLAYHGSVQAITEALLSAFGNKWATLFALWLVMLLLGCFLPPFAIVVIVAPMFLPFALEAGFDPVWFGVFITLNMEIGCITPPLGINLFVVKSVAPQLSMRSIILGSMPFLGILVLASLLLVLFPQIALVIPQGMMGY